MRSATRKASPGDALSQHVARQRSSKAASRSGVIAVAGGRGHRVDLADGAIEGLRPDPRVAKRFVHVTMAQAGGERPLDRHVQVARGRRQPERHLRVWLDPFVQQEVVGHPRDRPRAAAQQLRERERPGGAGDVERAAPAGLSHVQNPGGLVASVDELHMALGAPGPSTSPLRATRSAQ